jgi:ABC-type bacteriocin/lantibiotic exporter with double-glycine peptidase domain
MSALSLHAAARSAFPSTATAYEQQFIRRHCGVQVIYATCRIFGAPVDFEQLVNRTPANVLREGMSLRDMRTEFSRAGLYAVPVKTHDIQVMDEWLQKGEVVILHMPDHFVTCVAVRRDDYIVVDNDTAKRVSRHLLQSRSDNYLMRVSKTPITDSGNIALAVTGGFSPPAWSVVVALGLGAASVILAVKSRKQRRSTSPQVA